MIMLIMIILVSETQSHQVLENESQVAARVPWGTLGSQVLQYLHFITFVIRDTMSKTQQAPHYQCTLRWVRR